MPRSGMVEQDGRRRHRQAVGGIRAGGSQPGTAHQKYIYKAIVVKVYQGDPGTIGFYDKAMGGEATGERGWVQPGGRPDIGEPRGKGTLRARGPGFGWSIRGGDALRRDRAGCDQDQS